MQVLESSDEVNFSPLSRRYTLEEFWALSEREDHAHYNLIEGILFIVPPPNPPHGDLVSQMSKSLIQFLMTTNIAGSVYHPPEPIYCADSSTYLEPDILYVSGNQLRVNRTSADIVFEILSRSTSVYDSTTKADTYLALGVRELWLVDAVSATIVVRHASSHEGSAVWERYKYSRGQFAKSRVLDGWEVSVDEIFTGLTEFTR